MEDLDDALLRAALHDIVHHMANPTIDITINISGRWHILAGDRSFALVRAQGSPYAPEAPALLYLNFEYMKPETWTRRAHNKTVAQLLHDKGTTAKVLVVFDSAHHDVLARRLDGETQWIDRLSRLRKWAMSHMHLSVHVKRGTLDIVCKSRVRLFEVQKDLYAIMHVDDEAHDDNFIHGFEAAWQKCVALTQ